MTGRTKGLALACATAGISGVAVYLNARGVRAAGDATVYTTAKNVVAALVLVVLFGVRDSGRPGPVLPRERRQALGLGAVALVGGSVPFVLFFEGLARASSTHAAFVHKTLLVWVAVLAVPLLGERLTAPHFAAITLLISGQALAGGGLAGFRFGTGEVLILAATLLWSIEVIVAKRLMPGLAPAVLGVTRMVLGSILLVGWVALSGRWAVLTGLDGLAWRWALVTGLILAAYVATWFTALSLAPAVDVTSVLVLGALVTALLTAVDTGALPSPGEWTGLTMLLLGGLVALLVARGTLRARAPASGART